MDVKEQLYRALQAHEQGNTQLLASLVQALDDHLHPDGFAIRWDVDDVMHELPKLTREEALKVMREVEDAHDCTNGISWDTFRDTATCLGFDSSDDESEYDDV